MPAKRRIISIAHSYAVALNRRLAEEIGRAGRERWEITAVAPEVFHGTNDLRPVYASEHACSDACDLKIVPARLTQRVHFFHYGRALRHLLRGSTWDVVHCWEEPYIVVGAQIARWSPDKARLVYATFQNIPKRYPPPFNWIEQYSMRRASGWIAFGRTIHQTLGDRSGYSDRPVRTIPPGVDALHFHPDKSAGASTRRNLGWDAKGPPVVGYLGRFIPEKGLATFMSALDDIPDKKWRALVIGAGPMESELRGWAARHGDRVRVCTNVLHDQVPQFLNAMDLLVAPSQTTPRWREQFGRMLIEAFACGVPVIGSDSGEIPHVVGDAGMIVNESDVEAWTVAIGNCLDNPALRDSLAKKGLARVHENYAWPVVARMHLKFFDELLEAQACPS